MESQERDEWLTDDDLAWRPSVAPLPIDWRELKRAWDYRVQLEWAAADTTPQADSALWYAAHERAMTLAFAILGHSPRPRFKAWLGLGELAWKRELWLRMLGWEFSQWKGRIFEKSGHSNARTVNSLLRRMPTANVVKPSWTVNHEDSHHYEVAWRWLVARSRILSSEELSAF